jgi:flavin-dependent dehydrogenase
MTNYDAAIVGGGLAGCSAAITLAERGMRIALFEAKSYPQHKVCGEFLSPEAADDLAALGVIEALRRLKPARLTRARITAPDGAGWEAQFSGAGIGISRYALDAILVDRARALGVNVFEKTTVTRITGSLDRGFILEANSRGSFEADAVIAAHGKRSALDRALGRAFLDQPQGYIGLKAHFQGDSLPGRVDLHGFRGGYCGMSEIEGRAVNVCLLARSDAFQRAGGSIPSFVEWMQAQNPALRHWLSRAEPMGERWIATSEIPFNPKTTLEGDILMAGDSAGMIAPLAGDGMSIALRGGRMAAEFVARHLLGDVNVSDLRREYAQAYKRAFGARIRLGRFLQACLFEPSLLALGLRALNRFPALGHYIVTHTRGKSDDRISRAGNGRPGSALSTE